MPHKDPEDKKIYDRLWRIKNREKSRLAKCVMVCANCHGEIHNNDS